MNDFDHEKKNQKKQQKRQHPPKKAESYPALGGRSASVSSEQRAIFSTSPEGLGVN